MKKFKIISICIVLAGLSYSGAAQLKQVDFIKGGPDFLTDAQTLFQEYLTPYANAFGADLNAGWYNTGKPHKPLGFDVTITFNAAWAPVMDRTVDLSTLGLDATIVGDPVSPTVAGKRTNDLPRVSYMVDNPGPGGDPITLGSFDMPNGTGINVIPLPMAQLGLGLPFGTDVSVRFLPSLDLGKVGNIGLWGVGIKHSIFQHIPVLKRVPVIDASLQGGFTRLNTYANLNYRPDALSPATDITTLPFDFWNDQKVGLAVDAWTVNIVFSQTLPVITFYQAIGYATTSTNVYMSGMFPYATVEMDGDLVVNDDSYFEDPIDVEIQNNKDLRLNAGFRIKLGVLTLHADYTKANYSAVTAGIGISFR